MSLVTASQIANGQVCKMQCGCVVRATDDIVERCLPGIVGGNAPQIYFSHRKFNVLTCCANEPRNCDLHTDERMSRLAEVEMDDYRLELDPLISALYDEFECAA